MKGKQQGSGGYKSAQTDPIDTPTQEADFNTLLAARIRDQVEEMDIEIVQYALMRTYDEATLKEAMVNHMQTRGLYFRQLIQTALPQFLNQDRRVTLKPSTVSHAMNANGEVEGFTATPCPISQLPPVVQEAIVEDRLSQAFWDKSTRWVDAQGTHMDPVCEEVMSRLFSQDINSFANLIQSKEQMGTYLIKTLGEIKGLG